jgi:hypothetical protein
MLAISRLPCVQAQLSFAFTSFSPFATVLTLQFPTVLGLPGTSYGLRRLLLNKVQEEYELGVQVGA